MWTEIILFVFGYLLGIVAVIICWLFAERRDEKRMEESVERVDIDEWCEAHCKAYEECFSQWEDPNDAFKHLDEEHCSNGCPVVDAQCLLIRKKFADKKKVKKGD